MKKYIYPFLACCFLLLIPSADLYPQKRSQFNNVEVRTGYGYHTNGVNGLTSNTSDYVDKLSSGLSWDASYYIRFPLRPSTKKVRVGFGAGYSGYYSSGEREYSSDKLFLHSWFLNMALYYVFNERMELRGNFGPGMIYYLNNSLVYGKDRRVTGDDATFNLGLSYYYFLKSGLGFSLNLNYIFTGMGTLHSEYHGEKVKVTYPEDDDLMHRLNVSLGIIYRF